MSAQELELDLLVVGAGPAGIATAVEARRAGIERILLLEKGPTHSFSIEKLYPQNKRVDKVYLGQAVECEGAVCIMDGTRESVLATLDHFVQEFALPIHYDTEVGAIRAEEGGGFHLEDTKGGVYRSRTVVIAIGVYGRPNKPDYPLPGSLKERLHFDLTASLEPGQRILVVGGGNTALETAAYLYANHEVTLAYRGDQFHRANEINRQIIADLEAQGRLRVLRLTDVAGLRDTQDSPRVEVSFRNREPERFDQVVYALGGSTPQGFLQQAGVEMAGKQPLVDERHHSTVPGLFLAGDLVAGGKGSIVKAFNTGHRVVWEGLCKDHLECRIPGAEAP